LFATIQRILEAIPNLTARQIASKLSRDGRSIDRSSVNSELYRHRDLFQKDASEPPRWRAIGAITPAAPALPVAVPPPPQTPVPAHQPQPIALYAWQRQALDAWEEEGRQGVIEAVTGTGKTRVGMVAIQDAFGAGGCIHVLVPSIDLQEQWCRELAAVLPNVPIGRRGNGHADIFPHKRIIVSVVNSARDYDVGTLPPHSLLVADECHHYGAEGNAQALRAEFPRRLGLPATFAREDGGCEGFLSPYFGDTCFRLGYAQAIEDEVTAHFKVAKVGVDFATDAERNQYDAAAQNGRSARHWLISHRWAASEPFGEFMKQVSQLADNEPVTAGNGERFAAVGKARDYLTSFSTAPRRHCRPQSTLRTEASAVLFGAGGPAPSRLGAHTSRQTGLDRRAVRKTHRLRSGANHTAITTMRKRR